MQVHLIAPGRRLSDVYEYSDIARFYGFSSLFVCYKQNNVKQAIDEVDSRKLLTEAHIFISGLGVLSSSSLTPSWAKGVMAHYGGIVRKDYVITAEQANLSALEHLGKKITSPNIFSLIPTVRRDRETYQKMLYYSEASNACGVIPVFVGISSGIIPPHGQLVAARSANPKGRIAVLCDPSIAGNDVTALKSLGVTDVVFTFEDGFNHKSMEAYVAAAKGASQ